MLLRRLKDWWTRPSWQAYRIELEASVRASERADYAEQKLDVAMSEWALSSASCAEKIAELDAEAGRIQANLQKMKERFVTEVKDRESVVVSLADANAEIERLRGLMMKQVEDSPLERLVAENGAVDMAIRPPHWLIEHMSRGFFEALDDAPNWRAYEIGPMEHKGTRLIVTVCRASGDSPVETVTKCKAMLARWTEWYAEIDPSNDALFYGTRALLNPEKKD